MEKLIKCQHYHLQQQKYNENLNNNFKQFNDNLQSYFTNFTQAVGKVKFDGKNQHN